MRDLYVNTRHDVTWLEVTASIGGRCGATKAYKPPLRQALLRESRVIPQKMTDAMARQKSIGGVG